MKRITPGTPTLLVIIMAFAGCDSNESPPSASAGADSHSALVPDYQLETLEKAKQVDALVKKQDQKIRDAAR